MPFKGILRQFFSSVLQATYSDPETTKPTTPKSSNPKALSLKQNANPRIASEAIFDMLPRARLRHLASNTVKFRVQV